MQANSYLKRACDWLGIASPIQGTSLTWPRTYTPLCSRGWPFSASPVEHSSFLPEIVQTCPKLSEIVQGLNLRRPWCPASDGWRPAGYWPACTWRILACRHYDQSDTIWHCGGSHGGCSFQSGIRVWRLPFDWRTVARGSRWFWQIGKSLKIAMERYFKLRERPFQKENIW